MPEEFAEVLLFGNYSGPDEMQLMHILGISMNLCSLLEDTKYCQRGAMILLLLALGKMGGGIINIAIYLYTYT